MLKIILSNCTAKTNNRGSEALCVSLMSILDTVLKEKNIDYDLMLTDSNWSTDYGDCKYKITPTQTVVFRTISYPWAYNIKGNLRLMINPIKWIKNIISFATADFVLDIGQGDSFSDIYGKKRFHKINKVHVFARLFHRKYIFLPQTIGPFEDKAIRNKASKSLEKAELVMTRDSFSYSYTKEIAPKATVKNYLDVAFFLPFNRLEFNHDYVNVGLNVSALLWNGGYTQNNQFGLKDDYQNVIKTVIDYFLSSDNVRLHLIGHNVFSEPNIENDYQICCELVHGYRNPRLVLAECFLTPVDAKNYISGLDFFMGARMHATIASLSSGVPVVPMAYSRKFSGLFKDTFGYKHIANLKELDAEETLSLIKDCFANRVEIKNQIAGILRSQVENVKKDLVNDFRNIFEETKK